MKIKISIITVVYNSVETIEKTILSVIRQNFKDFEYIIVDGGSTDGTVEVIDKYRSSLDLFISEADNGIYDAMNKGIKFASGDLIGLINSGDYYYPDALLRVADRAYNSSADIFYSDMPISMDNGEERLLIGNHKLLFWDMKINHPTCFVKSEVYLEFLYDISYKIAADYDFFCLCLKRKLKFDKIESPLACMGVTGASSNVNLSILERRRVHNKYYGKLYSFIRYYFSKIHYSP